jgi:hypothetical protein
MSDKTRADLIALCKERGIKSYSGKTKAVLLELLGVPAPVAPGPIATPPVAKAAKGAKKERGQFYTTKASYILEGLPLPPADVQRIVEPFAGQGDILDWLAAKDGSWTVEAYDIDPKREGIVRQDTLRSPPSYADAWILTNPPYLARNKCEDKALYEMYATNDLFKCFLWSILRQPTVCRGGCLIIPAGFFFSPREIDASCRAAFMSRYRITAVKYFEETVFDDTTTTIVAFTFEASASADPLTEQSVEWIFMPSGERRMFEMRAADGWIVGGDIYALPVPAGAPTVRRHVEGQPLKAGEQQTFMTLRALDSGTQDGRIALEYKQDYIYPAKDCSRTYATLRLAGGSLATPLSEEAQIELCRKFNEFLEARRAATCSLFLPQFRESKEYARKRIPFELAYRIVQHILGGAPENTPPTQ